MSERRESITVERTLTAERLDTFLRSKLSDVSRGAIQRLIDEGHITVNGKSVKATHHPHAGEVIDIVFPAPKAAEAQPEDIPLDILFEDDDLLVLNKPAGIVVHPAAGNEEHTLVNALLHHCKGKLSGIGGVARPGIVHRLDKDTSGCLVVAKNDATHTALTEQFSGRSLEKIYDAIVCGELTKAGGEIIAAIARHPTQRQRMAVTESGGREAHTSWTVLQRFTHRPHASDPCALSAPWLSCGGRYDVRHPVEQTIDRADELYRTAANASRSQAHIRASTHKERECL